MGKKPKGPFGNQNRSLMKEMELRDYNRILADVLFENYKFTKSPYMIASWSQMITKSDPGDTVGRLVSEDLKSCLLFEG